MRVIICGGRRYSFTEADKRWLATLAITHIREGGGDGADLCAHNWAERHHVPCQTYRAEWSRYGRIAGPLRNTQMLHDLLADAESHKPIAVIAFPGGRGTADMVRQAREAGVRVIERTVDTQAPSPACETGTAPALSLEPTGPSQHEQSSTDTSRKVGR